MPRIAKIMSTIVHQPIQGCRMLNRVHNFLLCVYRASMEEQQRAMTSLTSEIAKSCQELMPREDEGWNHPTQLNSLQPLHSVCSLMTQAAALKRWPLNQARMSDLSTLYAFSANCPSSSHLETELERLACVLEKQS